MQQSATCRSDRTWSGSQRDCTADNTYVGCFNNFGTNSLDALITPVTNTPAVATNYVDRCRLHCLDNSFKYAGLVGGDSCRCDNVYNPYQGQNTDSLCDTHCSGGDSGFWCGGAGTGKIIIHKTADQCSPITTGHSTINTTAHQVGAVVLITCATGYWFPDNYGHYRVVTCRQNEVWSNTVHVCEGT
ncbi:uncharacterized protein LOC106166413 [Lingula anatina]|uniref:Uncharacterized protein LOC106166413 n=1 Tax=Lingula anatina TaxID=7574 RepID=A0A2R2MTE2_LINAN|nr:uncharacterized protein LOC106166413 [Lingula anatina]|eukprot:XP_023933383.1 uncharacterized protein LOC106166413 [Lingula anatina]